MRAAVALEAGRLIERFKEQAYFQARERVSGRCIDDAGSPRYWTAVKLEIARRQNITIGLAWADSPQVSRPSQERKENAPANEPGCAAPKLTWIVLAKPAHDVQG